MKARTRQAIAATLIAGGAWAFVLIVKLVGVLREQWPIAVASGQQGVIYGNGAILVGFVGLASAALIGGMLLWRNKNSGRRLAKVVLAAQVLFVAVPHFQYKMALLGFLGFGLAGSRFGLFFESSTQMFLEFDPDDLRAFVVNIPALLMLLALLRVAKISNSPQPGGTEVSSAEAGTG